MNVIKRIAAVSLLGVGLLLAGPPQSGLTIAFRRRLPPVSAPGTTLDGFATRSPTTPPKLSFWWHEFSALLCCFLTGQFRFNAPHFSRRLPIADSTLRFPDHCARLHSLAAPLWLKAAAMATAQDRLGAFTFDVDVQGVTPFQSRLWVESGPIFRSVSPDENSSDTPV